MKEAPAILKFLSWRSSSGILAVLSHDESKLLDCLLGHADSYTGEAWPSRATILKESGLRRRALLEARAWLKARGILSWHWAGKQRKKTDPPPGVLVYVINLDPLHGLSGGPVRDPLHGPLGATRLTNSSS